MALCQHAAEGGPHHLVLAVHDPGDVGDQPVELLDEALQLRAGAHAVPFLILRLVYQPSGATVTAAAMAPPIVPGPAPPDARAAPFVVVVEVGTVVEVVVV